MERLKKYFTPEIERVVSASWKELTEIKMRIHQPLILELQKGEIIEPGIQIDEALLKEILNKLTNYSLYAYEKELLEGYLTVAGGHRVGLAGEAIVKDGKYCGMKNIRFLNFRICRDLQHCGRSVFEKIKKRGTVCNTVICSPPGLGKTTLLRSLVQCCSDELCGTSVVVIDERNEISGSFQGIPQINLGMRTDVLSGVDKAGGILRAVRSMGPKIIAVDELGGEEDLQAIRWAMQSGVRILATIHSDCIQQTKSKLGQVLAEQFQCYVVISERGKYECYYD